MRKSLLAEVPQLPGRLRALLPDMNGGSTPDRSRKLQPRVRPAGAADQLALTEVRGNLTITPTEITVWYTLGRQAWPFRSDGVRETAIISAANQYATLAGLDLHVRRTTIPFPVHAWANNLAANSRPLPDSIPHVDARTLPGIDAWAGAVPLLHTARHEALERAIPYPPTWQQHLGAAVTRLDQAHYSDTRTQLGVAFPRPARLGRARDINAVLAGLAEQITQTGEVLAGPGLAARPSTTEEMLWLIYRSVGPGLTPPPYRPGDIDLEDIGAFADAVEFRRGRYDATTEVIDRHTGQSVHVAVLTMGRMEPLNIPQAHDPWANLSVRSGFPVEWSSRVMVLSPAEARANMNHQLLMIRSQQVDYADHDLTAPAHLARLADRGLHLEDEMDTALPGDATRVHGYHRLAVYDATADGALAKARELTRLYYDTIRAQLVHPKAQYHLMREFIPGEPAVRIGYLRRQPAKLFAAAVPQASAAVGDNRGDYLGYTATSARLPVMWDGHFAMEVRERSGLAVLVAEPGGGKSTLMGALGYLNARRGVQVTLMDPSGPLARLASMPELREFTRVVDLVGSGRGTLAPYAMIPTPRRGDYPPGPAGDNEYESEVELARAERYALVLDMLQMLLPATALEDRATVVALREAVRKVPREETSTLDDVIAQLHAAGRDNGNVTAATVGDLLSDMADLPLAKLFFGRPPAGILDTDAALTIITMGGLRLPDPKADRRYWSLREQLAVPMLHLANLLAVRRCYGGPMTSRKFVGLDEAHFMSGWESGRQFLIRLARDSRKWNLAALVASQNPRDILDLDVQNLVSTVFVGRIADDMQIASDAVRLLGEHMRGAGYESTVAGLSQVADTDTQARLGFREFLMRDVDNRVQKIHIDVSWIRGLLDTLDTTPGVLTGRALSKETPQ
jgi:hypothetical protein